MPVRFRCIYCNQLLGIARRKAGSIVHCTKCSGKIIVPNPDDPLPAPSAVGTASRKAGRDSGSHLFERSDFDVLLRQEPDLPNDQFRFDDLIRQGLGARNDPRDVVPDPHARYFGAELGERSLIPGDSARLGEIHFQEWLNQPAIHR